MKNKKIPVTLLIGYLGSGKTTVLNEILKSEEGKKIAIIENDIGALGIDAHLLRSTNNTNLFKMNLLVELSNGCICCTLRDEFMHEIEKLSKIQGIESIIVEASGVSDPQNIAVAFEMYENMHPESPIYLNSIVSIVDASRIYHEFLEQMNEYKENENSDTDIINLVIDQIEFCNLIILNKCDLITASELNEVKTAIRSLQKEAEIIEAVNGKIDVKYLLNSSHFDFDKVDNSSVVNATFNGNADDDEFGISSFCYIDRRPLDYDKFIDFAENQFPEELIRTKGFVWFGNDDIHAQLFEQAGASMSLNPMSNWVASFSKKEQEENFKDFPEIKDDWDPIYGDRAVRLVFIGKGYNKQEIISKMQNCIDNDYRPKKQCVKIK